MTKSHKKLAAICESRSLRATIAATALWAAQAAACLAADDQPPAPAEKTAAPAAMPAEIEASGTVQDADTGKPIAGAKVTIWEYEINVNGGLSSAKYLRHLECVTHGDGVYHFTISTEHAAKLPDGTTVIHVEIEVSHPEYASPWNYSAAAGWNLLEVEIPPNLAAARKRSTGSDQPKRELRLIEMIAGKRVTGVLQSPDGKPLAGVRVFASSKAPMGKQAQNKPEELMLQKMNRGIAGNQFPTAPVMRNYGWDVASTDEQGHFQFIIPTNGESTLRIMPAQDFAPLTKEIHDAGGDLGVIALSKGQKIRGRILDSAGKPLAGFYLSATFQGSDSIFRSDFISRATRSDEQGNFAFAPFGPGDYAVEPRDVASDLTSEDRHESLQLEKHPLPGFFSPQSMTLTAETEPKPLEFREIPAVRIQGHVSVSKETLNAMGQRAEALRAQSGRFGAQPAVAAQPPSSAELMRRLAPSVRAKTNGYYYGTTGEIDNQGNFTIKVPRGLTDAIVLAHSVEIVPDVAGGGGRFQESNPITLEPQWRTETTKPLVRGTEIPVGAVNENVGGIEVVYPDPPKAGR